jgi:hypothetical protein
MTRFLAAWVTQEAAGCAVAPKTRIRRVRCSITAAKKARSGGVNRTLAMTVSFGIWDLAHIS